MKRKFKKELLGILHNIATNLYYIAVKDEPRRDGDTVNPTPPPPPPDDD